MNMVLCPSDRTRSPKYLQVVQAIVRDIEGGTLRLGDRLPSINDACAEWYLSKDSVKRAYETLYQLGLITSVNRKGYFVAGQANRRALRVLIVAGQLTESVKQLHDAIADSLGREAVLDVCSYNYRQQLLCQVIDRHLGDYHYFVLMPHLIGQNPATLQCLRNVPGQQLILMGSQWQSVLQHGHQLRYGGEQALFDALQNQLLPLRKYARLNLVLSEHDCFDADSIRGFQRFCTQYGFDFQLMDDLTVADIEPQHAYFVANSHQLILLVEYSQQHGLTLGKQLGVVSFVENEYTRLLAGGVSVIANPSVEAGQLIARILTNPTEPLSPYEGTTNPKPAGVSVPYSRPYSLPMNLHIRASC